MLCLSPSDDFWSRPTSTGSDRMMKMAIKGPVAALPTPTGSTTFTRLSNEVSTIMNYSTLCRQSKGDCYIFLTTEYAIGGAA